jgi:ribonuclease HI
MDNIIRIFTDGGCSGNPGPMGIGVVVELQKSAPIIISDYAGEGTNNQAEYLALLKALEVIYHQTLKSTKICSDSNLMVQQVNGKWKCKDNGLIPLCNKAKDKIKWLKNNGFTITLEHIPREINVADIPAKNGYKNRKVDE